MHEYLYFSERLARKIVEENNAPISRGPKKTISIRPAGIGGDITWGDGNRTPATISEWAEAVNRTVDDHAVRGWDPNEGASFLRGRGHAFLGELVGGPHASSSAMVGSTYRWEGIEVNLCLFGSRYNLDGAVPNVDASRKVGWFSSSTIGVRNLLSLMPTDSTWDETRAFEHTTGLDEEDLVWSAANIMRGQGLVGDDNRKNAEAPSLRGHTVLEGDFEWLARIYWWRSGDPRFHNIAVGAPVYVRTISGQPWTVYKPLAPGEFLQDQPLTPGLMSPDAPAPVDKRTSNRRRPYWWPF